MVARVEIEHAAMVREPIRVGAVVENLIVPLLLVQVAAVGAQQGLGQSQPPVGNGLEGFVPDFGNVEIAHHNPIFVHNVGFVPPFSHPLGQFPQRRQAGLGAARPADVDGQKHEIEASRPE